MNIYILFAIASAISLSFAIVLNKHVLKNILSDFKIFVLYICLLDTIFALLIWSIIPTQIPSPHVLPFIVANALFYFASVIVANYTFLRGDVSIVGPLTQTKTLFLIFLAFIFLGEFFSINTYMWIILMIIGGMIVSMDENFKLESFLTTFTLVILFSNFLWAMTDIMAKNVLLEMDAWNANAWRMVFMGPLSLTLIPFLKRDKLWIGCKRITSVLSVFLLSEILGVFLLFQAFDTGPVTISNAFAMMRGPFIIIITFVLSRIKPSMIEYHSKRVYMIRFIGSAIMVFSAAQLIL